ncbi:ABC transporter ATP-binding protein [Romboutsia lituseburensis]|uniref:ABC transporter ATP-binding protein n=1 Tax=Romboutsia lituseburensis TaxID=1537 RepID=UPI00215B2C65|nr:energy-coupling factor transporter ATPase [Romboutsia lituseburensis]MCR8743803.1 energy-coupling factor transporter ATPase [Romboutsia lituseburensis]
MEILRLDGLKFSYPNKLKKALNKIDISIKEGEFVLICGQSGCGKSTLLRHLKPELRPHGKGNGKIFYYSKNINEYPQQELVSQIGYVLQNPDAQIVTDKVWHELAFGLENLGLDTQTIRIRVAEMASFFGIQGWFRKSISDLSGGQKQLLNLAAIMVMQPKVLILDEPTSQLDPIASKEFIDTLVRINKELSTTIIITEHNLEDIFSIADKVIVMDDGNILCNDTPQKVVDKLYKIKHSMFKAMPTSSKVYSELKIYLDTEHNCPLTVKEGKQWLNDILKNRYINSLNSIEKLHNNLKVNEIVIELKDVWFQYSKNLEPVLRNVSFKVYKGDIYSILGGNGTGKTTTLSIISKQRKAQRGQIFIKGKEIKKYNNKSLYEENLAILPQNPQSLFVQENLKSDLEEVLILKNKSKEQIYEEVNRISELLEICHLLNQHPYDLSGGELQRAGLAKIMLSNPQIILLDEPTKGLDNQSKEDISKVLLKLKSMNVTIILVSHDIEFSARYSDRCAMFFDGMIVSEGTPRQFFLGNNFYTTVANRMTRNIFEDTLIYEDVVKLCKLNLEKKETVSL